MAKKSSWPSRQKLELVLKISRYMIYRLTKGFLLVHILHPTTGNQTNVTVTKVHSSPHLLIQYVRSILTYVHAGVHVTYLCMYVCTYV